MQAVQTRSLNKQLQGVCEKFRTAGAKCSNRTFISTLRNHGRTPLPRRPLLLLSSDIARELPNLTTSGVSIGASRGFTRGLRLPTFCLARVVAEGHTDAGNPDLQASCFLRLPTRDFSTKASRILKPGRNQFPNFFAQVGTTDFKDVADGHTESNTPDLF